jgi:glycopeptide antibiotics resistance protein
VLGQALIRNHHRMNLQETGRNSRRVDKLTDRFTIVLFFIYVMVLCWILLFKLGVQFSYMGKRSVNLVPFSEFFFTGTFDAAEIILNVLIFVPAGIYAGMLFEYWNSRQKLFFFLLFSLLVEGLQFILAIGAFDITDVITNSIGGILGLMIFKAIEKAFANRLKAKTCLNYLAATGTLIIVLLLFLLKMNLLPFRYQ